MAPVVCLPDITMPRVDAACPYARRRQRSRVGGIGGKHRDAEMRQMPIARVQRGSLYDTPPASPITAPDSPIGACFPNSPESSLCARIPYEREDQWIITKRRQGLLNIVARTVALVRRNYILEKKVEALRLETRSFIRSVLKNPGNNGNERRQEITVCSTDSKADNVISSSTDRKSARPLASPTLGAHVYESRRIICTDKTAVTSTCNSKSMEREVRSADTLVR